jgi:YbgC/YbaW family acyl-CoA thioester hydrolase
MNEIISSTTYKIKFVDCDLFGHLNNSKYIDYFLSAREDHLAGNYKIDLANYYKQNMGWTVSGNNILYLNSAKYNEIVTIESSIIKLSNDFLVVEMVMYDQVKKKLKSILWSKLTATNLSNSSKTHHPQEFYNWAKLLINGQVNYEEGIFERIKQIKKTLD